MAEQKILILGSGSVAKPCVDYLVRCPRNTLTVACRTLSTAEKVVAGRPRATAIALDVASPDLDRYIKDNDVVVSLVPFVYHARVIRSAIEGKTHVVTTSYVSPAIRELDTAAKEAGIIVLNEVGVDPGVDHLYAIKTIDEVHKKGGKVREFYSYCGGLPAPEASNNPLRFKFSWSPRGALLSQQNSATFLQDGEVVHISNKDLMGKAHTYHVMDGYSFLAYPNRDSVPFREAYQIPEAHTVIRGSLRYEGNPALVRVLIDLGWLDTETKPWLKDGMTWAQIQKQATGAASSEEADLIEQIDQRCHFASPDDRQQILSGLRWMGLFSDDVPQTLHGNLLDTLSEQLQKLCSFQSGERDLVMLQHKFVVEWEDGTSNTITSTLELFGDPDGYSGMARAVGVTCGIATQLLLDGCEPLNRPGVLAPYTKDICDPIRLKLKAEGITLTESMFGHARM
ncbi:saccharopine dehydrogenase [Plectosphaerella plurivora]|uniref:Saccharopine dehydrogenase n=1 Tax=Plectosphaerella plurivora TaxID=936078 RepID=A0A9P8V7C1_9PEZI|nr:saccharopine dehydrogenase [Plectosphaerella plurivora]